MFEARFQSFEDPPRSATGPRITALRAELTRRGLSGFILPRTDRHQNENLPPSEERLAWLTGFSGSAGSAVVLPDRAVLFTDGRYTLQARSQVDVSVFTLAHLVETPPAAWLEANLPAGSKLGYDPWLHTVDGAERLAQACTTAGATFIPTEPNPIDALWTDRPPPPHGEIVLHDLRFAGESASSKLARISAEIGKGKTDALVVSDPQVLAWTFNIRGADVPHTPLPLGFAVIPQNGRPTIYVDGIKLSNAVRHTLAEIADIREPADFARDLSALGSAHRTVRFDQVTGAEALSNIVAAAGGKVRRSADPITAMKAIKNKTEIEGARAAHRRDGAALSNFLAWFNSEAPNGKLTEIDAVAALETFRRKNNQFKDISFDTISGAGPNGAIVHYRVTSATNRKISPGEIFLVDSGAQYEDGTTDVTRTVVVGTPSAEMRTRNTLVLKGHIAIARAVFPEGTTGAQLDSFARAPLWAAGLDYDHGTGHGVGSYLSVHEGPARISKLGSVPLKRGMILSNEPGYYKTGAYGIRIENLILVVEAPVANGGEKSLNTFETLTLAPIDQRLIDPSLLHADEILWLDNYHARVELALSPLVDTATKPWLEKVTRPLSR